MQGAAVHRTWEETEEVSTGALTRGREGAGVYRESHARQRPQLPTGGQEDRTCRCRCLAGARPCLAGMEGAGV